jgi:hypothetical protein
MADALIAASLEAADRDRLHTGSADSERYDGTIDIVFL